ncbi:Uncharacterised protein [Bordetella ansorpii]|uniref:Uncharacterized protein n=2 Tax=Bordetella ansorpii TaxID=288768 RepID=A0A157QNY8_9BORD|nr:Uncharacterised protein [Bordetella ansorpii]
MDSEDRETQTRRTKLRQWIFAHFPTVTAFASQYGLNQGEISGLLRNKSFGPKRARSLEKKVGMPIRHLELDEHADPVAPRVAWPFKLSTYDAYQKLSAAKRRELDIRIAEFIAGATLPPNKTVTKRAARPTGGE